MGDDVSDGQFGRMCDVLGIDALATDPRFATNEARVTNREPLRPLIVAETEKRR